VSSVVVVGGGYGGTLAAKELDSEADVTLIDPREGFVNAAASLRALTQPDWAHHAFFPFETLLERGRVIRDQAVSVDPKGVTLASGERVEADYLVLATGSSYSFPAKPNQASTSIAQQLDDLRATHKELAGAGRVLILGAGPVGLELAGEIKEVWPDKDVVIIDRGDQLLPGFLPEVRDGLRRQLAMTAQATVPVTERLNVQGYEHAYALGDITALPDPKMASYAMTHADVVVTNIKAQLAAAEPGVIYTPAAERRILLPLGPHAGVGQLPASGGVAAATPETVHERKGADLFTARFTARFSRS
jgi:NADH dehydrogenase FAD-containing subunit